MNTTAKAHISSSGVDLTGLGRWNWTRLEGQYNTFSTCDSAYCPCASNSGLSTTWKDRNFVKYAILQLMASHGEFLSKLAPTCRLFPSLIVIVSQPILSQFICIVIVQIKIINLVDNVDADERYILHFRK